MTSTTLLLDSDLVVYRCAAVTENQESSVACYQAGEMVKRILDETNASAYKCFLSGENNFRYLIYPEYKANRKDIPKPKHFQTIREYLVSHWGASVTDGHEADDALGVEQCRSQNTAISSIDKDLLMIPGHHYNFVKKEWYFVDFLQSLHTFYAQCLLGDKTDNVPGYDGKFRSVFPKFFEEHVNNIKSFDDELDMYTYVRNVFDDDEIFHRNAKCLWIWRKENDVWNPPQ